MEVKQFSVRDRRTGEVLCIKSGSSKNDIMPVIALKLGLLEDVVEDRYEISEVSPEEVKQMILEQRLGQKQ